MLRVNTKYFGTVAVLYLQGRIVNGDTLTLRNAIQSLAEATDVKLDLAGVTSVDAHGLGVMLELRENALARGMNFELMNLTDMVSRVFEITRLDSVFRISSRTKFIPTASRLPCVSTIAA